MKPSGGPGGLRRLLVSGGYALALFVGGVQGFLFGARLGGPLMATIVAINSALFCALMFGAVAGWLSRNASRDEASKASRLSSRPRGGD